MNGEEKAWVIGITVIVLGVVSSIGFGCLYGYSVTRCAMENGYVQKIQPGTTGACWVKE